MKNQNEISLTTLNYMIQYLISINANQQEDILNIKKDLLLRTIKADPDSDENLLQEVQSLFDQVVSRLKQGTPQL